MIGIALQRGGSFVKKKKKGWSCLGIFVLTFLLSTLALAVLVAVGALISIYGFGWDPALWTDVSVWNSYPFLALYGVLICSGLCGFGASLLGALVGAIFGGGKEKEKKAKRRSRPQSNRKTTL